MKSILKITAVSMMLATVTASCKKSDSTPAPTVYYEQQDQMARPAINTVFVTAAADKDAFNTTPPSAMSAAFQAKFQTRLLALNSGYTTNALGQSAAAFTGFLSTDVLNVSVTGATSFLDLTTSPATVLTGRRLDDDVIDAELTLIFGGPNALTGSPTNPGLISDHVNGNDKAFLTTFPYLASPW